MKREVKTMLTNESGGSEANEEMEKRDEKGSLWEKEEPLCCRETFLRTEDQTVKGAFGDHDGSPNDIEKQDYELLRSQKPTSRSPAEIRLRQKIDDPASAGQFGEENERVMLPRTVTKDGINGENMTSTDNVSYTCKDSKWNSLSPPSSENGRNLVQFMNSASNDIKEAIDRSSLRGSPLVPTITSNPSFDQTIGGQCVVREVADRKKCYFHTSRDSSALANPVKVLKVEPLNIVKVKPMGSYICEPNDTCDKKKHIRSLEKSFEYSPPSKRPKLSANFNLDKLFDGSKDNDSAETRFSPKTQKDPSCNSDDDADESFNRDRKDSPSTNPLPLRKRRLPASFWQEPGKSQAHPPRKTVESPSRHTAFMPITPRRDSSSFGRYVKDFLGSSLSASEKLELLRLNSLERDNFNHLCSSSPSSSRDFSDRRCHSYPCVLMHCKKQHEDVSARGNFPSFYPRSDQPLLHAPQGVPSSLSYPTRSIFANHYERHAANILGTPHPGISSHYPEFFIRQDDVIDSSYGSRIIFPFEPNGSPFFPLYSHFNPNVIRPVPKKHLSNMSGPYHSSFDVR